MTNIKTLFGLSVGERVKYIANDEKDYDVNLHNSEGTIMDINHKTAEFHVKLNDRDINYAFYRYELLRIGESLDDKPFKGILLKTKEMSIGEVRNYLINYHFFTEGEDFSITENKGVREVFLHSEKYSQLINDLITLKVITEIVSEDKVEYDIKRKLRSEIVHGECLTLFFEQSGWTFRTQVGHLLMYESVLKHYGVDLNV